jgi:hypothetical protein
VAAAAQADSPDGAILSVDQARIISEAEILNQTVKHHWHGDRSPSTEQRSEDSYGFKGPTWQSAASKTVILDRENPPQIRSGRTAQD